MTGPHRTLQRLVVALGLASHLPTLTSAINFDDLDDALLSDILESYVGYEASKCASPDLDAATSFSFTFPGTNSSSRWANDIGIKYEEGLFQAIMTHTNATDPARDWTIRIGTGGNLYSHVVPNGHGETMPPQAFGNSPWVDEVEQTISVNLNINNDAGLTENDNFPYFIHQAGAYKDDLTYMDSAESDQPFYAPSLAKHCSGNSCSFASWGTQAHVPTKWTSPVMYINRYTNCGRGVIEHTQIINNFAFGQFWPQWQDQTYFNVGWGGVRASSLPVALEPSAGSLKYDDVNAVDHMPLCTWGTGPSDHGQVGRSLMTDIQSLGGYTTFVADGLLVNHTEYPLQTWCRKPAADCYGSPGGCMVSSCSDAQVQNEGYTRVPLGVAPGGPNCKVHKVNNPFRGFVALQCDFQAEAGFGQSSPQMSTVDPCAPWKKARIGFRNTATGATLEVAYVRHWSWNPNNRKVYFSVFGEDSAQEAIDKVNAMFSNTDTETIPIELRTVRLPERDPDALPWCRKYACNNSTRSHCMTKCTDKEAEENGWDRIELAVNPGGPQCTFWAAIDGYVGLACMLRPTNGFGHTFPEANRIQGFFNTKTGKTLEVRSVGHWSREENNNYVWFATYTLDDGGPSRNYAINTVNQMFANEGTEAIPIEIRRIDVPPIQPWCKWKSCDGAVDTCMGPCTDEEIATSTTGYPVRITLQVNPGVGFPCRNQGHMNYNGLIGMSCQFRSTADAGQTAPDVTTPIGFRNTVTGQTLEVAHVLHWSWGMGNTHVWFSVFTHNDGSRSTRNGARNAVNAMFANWGAEPIPIEIVPIDPAFVSSRLPATNVLNPHPLSNEIASVAPEVGAVPNDYNPAQLSTFTYVYGKGIEYNSVPGWSRRRLGSTDQTVDRDYSVFTINWLGSSRVRPGETYHNRAFMFSSDLGSVEATAEDLTVDTMVDLVDGSEYSSRAVDLYQLGTSFIALAASSAPGASTSCSSTAALVCSGKSTPQTGYSPFFYINCGSSTYVGPDPLHFAPPFNAVFPNHGDANNIVRSYVCNNEIDKSVRPTWKLLGFFDRDTCTGLTTSSYNEKVCDAGYTASPTTSPTQVPSDSPSLTQAPSASTAPSKGPTASPTASPTACKGYTHVWHGGSANYANIGATRYNGSYSVQDCAALCTADPLCNNFFVRNWADNTADGAACIVTTSESTQDVSSVGLEYNYYRLDRAGYTHVWHGGSANWDASQAIWYDNGPFSVHDCAARCEAEPLCNTFFVMNGSDHTAEGAICIPIKYESTQDVSPAGLEWNYYRLEKVCSESPGSLFP